MIFRQLRLNTFVARLRAQNIPLRLRLWNGNVIDLGVNPKVTVTIPRISGLRYLLNPSLDNMGHAYVEKKIELEGQIEEIVEVASLLATHGSNTNTLNHRPPVVFQHTHKTDADAIAYHYDVSNEFYSLWLDRNMVYSCGYFRSPEDHLEDAQIQKIDHILTKIRIQPGDRLLDVGCGWGALIMRAAEKFGAKTLGITLSKSQYELAQKRIEAAGLSDRCEVRLEDYRDVSGTFDRITSVGMFEHVGLKDLRNYFTKLQSLLTDNGVIMNHGITSTDPESGNSPWGGGDFIDRYVFPGGELPHISLAMKEMCAAGLEPVDVESLRRHYALTLTHWTKRFEANGARLRQIAGEKRWRIWRVYLAGCSWGFAHSWMSIHQILAVKAGSNVLPLTRDYMYGR